MNSKRILSAIAVLALTVGCAWASTSVSAAAGFTVIPDQEAVQIVGSGRACTDEVQAEGWYWCDGQWMVSDPLPYEECGGNFVVTSGIWACEDAPSGECYADIPKWMYYWCPCQWFPEYETCSPNNDWHTSEFWAYSCQ